MVKSKKSRGTFPFTSLISHLVSADGKVKQGGILRFSQGVAQQLSQLDVTYDCIFGRGSGRTYDQTAGSIEGGLLGCTGRQR